VTAWLDDQLADRRHLRLHAATVAAGRSRGIPTTRVAPLPGALSTPIDPPWASTITRLM
jgi:hypothetical protein